MAKRTATVLQDRWAEVQDKPLLKGSHQPPNGVAEGCAIEWADAA